MDTWGYEETQSDGNIQIEAPPQALHRNFCSLLVRKASVRIRRHLQPDRKNYILSTILLPQSHLEHTTKHGFVGLSVLL